MLMCGLLTSPTAAITQAAKSANAEWVVVVGLGAFEQLAEDLVVATGRQLKALLDEGFFWSGFVPPTALEIDDCPVAFSEFHRGRCSSANRSNASTLTTILC